MTVSSGIERTQQWGPVQKGPPRLCYLDSTCYFYSILTLSNP